MSRLATANRKMAQNLTNIARSGAVLVLEGAEVVINRAISSSGFNFEAVVLYVHLSHSRFLGIIVLHRRSLI